MSVIFNESGGGVNYVSDTLPSSPSAGELWYKTSDNGAPGTTGLWRYTGAYWVSEVSYWVGSISGVIAAATINAAIRSASAAIFVPSPIYPYFKTTGTDLIWVESWSSNWFATAADTGSVVNSDNSFNLYVGLKNFNLSSSPLTVNSLSQIFQVDQRQLTLSQTVQQVVNMTTFGDLVRPSVWAAKINGTPSVTMPFWISAGLDLRKVHP